MRLAALTVSGLMALWVIAELYSRWPSGAVAPPISLRPGAQDLIVLVHGSFGREEPTLVALESRLATLAASRQSTQIVRYRWAPWSDNIFRAHSHGTRIGAQLGHQLATAFKPGAVQTPRAMTLHLIAHSAGAYVLDPLCERLRQDLGASAGRVFIRMTFLDPIGLRGLLERGWGARNLGRCADDAEAWINTDDPAPATDRWLQHAWNIDVTAAQGHERFSGGGHRWPVQYFAEQVSAADLELATSRRDVHPPGRGERR